VKKKHPNLIKIGKQIRRLREKLGFSQEAFAAEVGIDRSYMGGIERGERNISALNLIRIAKAMDVEVGALFPSISELKL
jgi:transcriptional regulator with XRE-family HTH domain